MSPHSILDGGHDILHWVAAAVLVVGGVAVLAISGWARARPRPEPTARSHPAPAEGRPAARSSLAIVAGLSACAGIIHLAAAPGHFADIGDLAAGFLAAGVFQLAWAAKVAGQRRPMSPRLRLAGAFGNAAIIVAWALARTVGVPPGHVDPIALPDAAATAFEALIVVGIVLAAVRPVTSRLARVRPLPAVMSIAVVPVVGLAIVLTSLATLAIAAGADHGLPSGAAEHVVVGQP